MGGPYKLKKRGKPMTTIYDAAILLVDDNPDLLTLVTDNLRTAGQNRTSRRCFSRRGTPTRTGCSGWGLARTTI